MVVNWNLKHLCENKEQWEKFVEQLEEEITELTILLNSNHLLNSLSDILNKKIKMDLLIEKIYCYPRRRMDLNHNDIAAKEMFHLALKEYAKTEKINTLFQRKVIKHFDKIEKFVHQNPYYQRYFSAIIRNKDHLVENHEQYASLQESLEMLKDIYHALIKQDLKFKQIEIGGQMVTATPLILNRLSNSKNQDFRRQSFEVTMEAYQNIENTMASIYQNKLKTELLIEQCQNFSSVLEANLFRG